jgi:hypothetical protein
VQGCTPMKYLDASALLYSPECVEGRFSELRMYSLLGGMLRR